MKPPPFTYHAPTTVDEALTALECDEGKVLAGGQSLVPLLNMRLAAPEHLVDIGGVARLDTVDAGPGGVRVGATVRQSALEHHDGAHRIVPLLRQALRHVAHPVIRNRGTVVGSLAHADPAGELTAVLALLGGSVEAARTGRRRQIPARAFFVGSLETCLEPDELAVSAYFPALPARGGTAFAEVARRHGDYALAGVAAAVTLDDGRRVSGARVACTGVGPTPVVLDLTGACADSPADRADWAAAGTLAADGVRPAADIHASAEYRRHLVRVLAERALREAGGRAMGET
ncbi:MAG: FAD binding domain-containing protein [Streptosporangiaceae bacterium]